MKRILLITFMLVSALVTESWAQTRSITGTVTSAEDGSTLPGVNVILKGTTTGTVTDVDGNYRLDVPEEAGILTFSFIGLASQEVEIGARSVVDVQMESDVKQLNEVVVTAFGLEREKKALGYAVQDISGEEISQARETNVVNSLSGKIAGVQVTNVSGSPGASSRIVLRGASSLTGNNQPLFVVDGIPINNETFQIDNPGTGQSLDEGGLSSGGADMPNGASVINPDDIETISVLKGPNAAALYGSRASNGVILITTKSGRGTKGLGISVNSTATFQEPLRLPSYQNSYGGGYSNTFYEFIDGSSGSGGEDESWGPPLDKGLEFVQWNDFDGTPSPWVSQPDNIKDFFETGKIFSNNVAITGGGEKANFRLSLNNMQQEGMVPNTELERNTVSLNAGAELTDKFRAETSVSYIKSQSDNIPGGGYDNNNPMQQFTWFQRNVDINALRDYNNLPLAAEGTSAAGTPATWNTNFNNNVFWVLDNNTQGFENDRVIGNIRLNYDFTDWLSLSVRTGTDYFTDNQEAQRAVGSNDFPNGNYREISRTWYETNTDFLLSFNKELSSEFRLNLAFGGNQMRQNYSRNYLEAPELQIPGVYNLSNSRITVISKNYDEQKRINSLYGTGQLGFRNYLFLDVTARNDWSSTLPADNNSYFYPSVSLSAVVSDIFEVQSDVLTFAKIRGSWAQVGSDTDPYRLNDVFAFFDPWNGSTIAPTVSNTLLNPDLKPEITTSLEFGADLRFLSNRVRLDFTYYDETSTDIIVPVDISGSSGYTSRYANVGEMTNKGIEVQLSGTPIETEDLQWTVGVNFAKNKNEVVTLGGNLERLVLGGQWNADIIAAPGEAYGAIYGTAFLRDDEGNLVHENGLPVQDENLKILGNVSPDWTGGISTNISYKGINFGALVDAKIGGDIYSMTNAWGRYSGILEETLLGREHGIVGDGVKNIGTEESPEYVENNIVVTARDYNHSAFGNSVVEGSVFDASYIKLRELSLGYTLPNNLISRTPFRDVTFSVVGRNLALLYSKVPHIDPETAFTSGNAQGLEHAQLPSARSIGFNLSFKL